MIEIKFVKTHDDAILPTKNNASDSGWDVYSVTDCYIPPKGSCVVNVGLTLGYITPGWWFKVETRSGMGFKSKLLNHPGIIDCDYRGDLGILIHNLSDFPYQVKKGDRIAQFVIYQVPESSVSWISEPVKSNRGASGFGSSGK